MADEEQFSLCWNNFNSNLSRGLYEALRSGDFVDVTLAAEGQLIKAHRLVLSICSPYFRKMFTQVPANQHAFVFLKDVSYSALKDLIQFMYCGEVNVKQDALNAFISTAEALQIKGLAETDESDNARPPPTSVCKLESEESSEEKVITATTTGASVAGALKRTHKSVTPQVVPASKRIKRAPAPIDPLEATETTQITIQTQIGAGDKDTELINLPNETLQNPKSEPTEIETADQEAYVKDESYVDVSKYVESYFCEGDRSEKPGQSSRDHAAPANAQGGLIGTRLKAKYVIGKSNKPRLTFEGNTFRRNRIYSNALYWLCTKYNTTSCPATLKTDISGEWMEVLNPQHSHSGPKRCRNKAKVSKKIQEKPNSPSPPSMQ